LPAPPQEENKKRELKNKKIKEDRKLI